MLQGMVLGIAKKDIDETLEDKKDNQRHEESL